MPRVRKVKKSNSKNHMVWRIAVYIRLSKDDGNDESLSVTNQKKIIREYFGDPEPAQLTSTDVVGYINMRLQKLRLGY